MSSNISKSISSLLLQCGDIEKNPGPFPKVFLGTIFFPVSNNSFEQKSCLRKICGRFLTGKTQLRSCKTWLRTRTRKSGAKIKTFCQSPSLIFQLQHQSKLKKLQRRAFRLLFTEKFLVNMTDQLGGEIKSIFLLSCLEFETGWCIIKVCKTRIVRRSRVIITAVQQFTIV